MKRARVAEDEVAHEASPPRLADEDECKGVDFFQVTEDLSKMLKMPPTASRADVAAAAREACALGAGLTQKQVLLKAHREERKQGMHTPRKL